MLSPAKFLLVREVVLKRVRSKSDPLIDDNPQFGRRYIHNDPLLKGVHSSLERRATELAGVEVQKSFSFLSMYGPKGIAPSHKDRRASRFVINLCVDQDAVWPLFVGEDTYLLGANDAVFFCGSRIPHHREPIRSKYCRMVSFFFVSTKFRGALCRPGRE